MYIVEYCQDDLFRPGATFTRISFDCTLRMGGWPEGTIFRKGNRRIIIRNGYAVELKADEERVKGSARWQ